MEENQRNISNPVGITKGCQVQPFLLWSNCLIEASLEKAVKIHLSKNPTPKPIRIRRLRPIR
jgi:hypothetical protein